jgi:hypothetical protein
LNTAVVLNCILSWQEGGGAGKFNYVPVLNFQNEGDKTYGAPVSDQNGNYLYISFGPGWCVIPAILFKFLSITANPLNLEIFNLLLHFISCLLLFKLCTELFTSIYPGNYSPNLFVCSLFLLNPSLLWVMGNAYSPGSAALPFELTMIYFFTIMLRDPVQINWKNLLFALIAGFGTIYCDWVGVFLAFFFGAAFIFLRKKDHKYRYAAWVFLLLIPFSVALLMAQYVSYAGWEKTSEILSHRFLYRTYSPGEQGISYLLHWSAEIFFTRNLPLILVLGVGLGILKRAGKLKNLSSPAMKVLLISIAVLLIHNLCFLGWTAANDFSVMNYCIPFSILGGAIIIDLAQPSMRWMMLSGFFILSVLEYYYFNRPGANDRKGQPYATYQLLGEQIRLIARPDEVIFTNSVPAPQGWYYANRTYFQASDSVRAKEIFQSFKQKHAVFIHLKEGRVTSIQRMSK